MAQHKFFKPDISPATLTSLERLSQTPDLYAGDSEALNMLMREASKGGAAFKNGLKRLEGMSFEQITQGVAEFTQAKAAAAPAVSHKKSQLQGFNPTPRELRASIGEILASKQQQNVGGDQPRGRLE